MKLDSGMGPSSLVLDAARHIAGRATLLEPVVFDGHIGALHRPTAQTPRGVTVVLCPPVGRDARCAYRPLFLFAEALAAQGVPVLRYDHAGDGDSLSLDAEIDRWPLWSAGLEQAAAFARAHTGAQRLVLAGLRIGASLAASAARSVKPDGLILLAPLSTGRAWVRELQVAGGMVGMKPAADGSIDIDGLRLSSATVASLNDLDLRRQESIGVETFLAMPTADARLAASLGPKVRAVRFDGYAELFREAHLNAPPGAVFEAAAAWLEGFAAATPDAAPAPPPPPARLVAEDWTDWPVSFGADLRGVLCLPARPAPGPAVIIGNTGGDPRAGIGSFAARACRALASRGVAALRFDFAGLGESASPDSWRAHLYETDHTPDFRAAADLLAQKGYGDVALVGVCTGGYQALRAGVADDRFRRIMTINSWLIWRPGDSLEMKPVGESVRPEVNVLALAQASGWRRLLSGEIDPRMALASVLRRLGRLFRLKPHDAACRTARAEIARLAAGGAKVRVVIGRYDATLEETEQDFGLHGRWLARQPGFEVAMIRNLDHGLFSRESQDLALAEIFRFVGLSPEADGLAARTARGDAGLAPSTNRQAAL